MPPIRTTTSIKQRSPSPYIKPEPTSEFAIPSLPPHVARKVKRADTPRPSTYSFADFACFRPIPPPTPNDRKLAIEQLLRDLTPFSDLTSLSPTPQPIAPIPQPYWQPGQGLIVHGYPSNAGPSYHHHHCRRDVRLRCRCILFADLR